MLKGYRWLAAACVAAMLAVAASPLLAVEPKAAPEGDQPAIVVTRAVTEGTVEGNLARLTVVIEVESHKAGEQRLPLFAATAAVTDWSVSSGWFGPDAYVRRTDKGLELVMTGEGTCKVSLELVAQVRKERLVSKATLPMVGGLVTRGVLTVPGKDLEVKVQPELGMEIKASGETTTVTVYGGEGDVEVSWSPKAPEKELKPIAFADQTTMLRISQGVMRITSVIDYSIVQGSLGEFQVRLPKDLSLLNIEGGEIRTWDVEESAGAEYKTLKVVLLGAVEKQYKLSLNMEKVLPKLEMDVDAPSIEPQGVMREKGQIAVSAAKGIRVEAGKLDNISHVDVREMAGLPVAAGDEVRLGFRYLKRPFSLTLRTGEVLAKTSVEVLTLVRAGMDSMRLSTTLNYTIRDAGVFQFQVSLDKGLKLADINGQNINNWQLDEAGHVLTVALRSKAEGEYSLQIETETPVAKPESAPIPVIHAQGVDKEVGYVAVLPAPGMKVETAGLTGVSQIDVKELPATLQKQAPALAYRYIRPDYQVSVNVSLIEPEVEAEVQTVAVLDEKELSMDTEILYSIRRAGIFQLRVAIPKELRRTNVEGADVDDTSYDDSKGILTVNLRSKVMDKYVLKIATAKPLESLEKGVELPVISLPDVKKERGFIAVATKASVRLIPDKAKNEGLSDIGVNDLPPEMLRRMTESLHLRTEGILSFKYFTQPWRMALSTERIQPQVEAEVCNLLSIGEKLVSVSATVNYTIKEAGVDTFVVKLPAGAIQANVDGASIKNRQEDKEKSTWTVTTQSKLTGAYALYVNFQQKVAEDQKLIPYTGVEVAGVNRETGYLAITSRGDTELKVGQADVESLTPIDSREIPPLYMRGITLPVLLAYRYVSHPYSINMGALQHDAAEVTVAVVESARLSTTLTEQGEMLTDMVCILRNTRQQYLDMKLPAGAKIMHGFVTYQDASGMRRTDYATLVDDKPFTKVLVAQSAAQQQRPLEIRLRYAEKGDKLGRMGRIELKSPFAGIDVMRLGWALSLPEGYDIVRDMGSIRRLEWPGTMEPMLQQLQPDTEVRVEVQARETRAKQMEDYQVAFNAQASDQSIAQGKGGQRASVYTGAKPVEGKVFEFQSLIVSKDEPAAVKVAYMKGSLGIPLKGVVVLLVALVCGALWRAVRWRAIPKVGAILAATIVVLGVRTLTEGAYRDYLTTIIYTLLAMAGLLLLWTIIEWVRRRQTERDARLAALRSTRRPPSPPAPPAPPEPKAEPKQEEQK